MTGNTKARVAVGSLFLFLLLVPAGISWATGNILLAVPLFIGLGLLGAAAFAVSAIFFIYLLFICAFFIVEPLQYVWTGNLMYVEN